MANPRKPIQRDSAILTRPAFVGRYSYDDPPAPGDTVISPNGRVFLVINVTPDRTCICQPQSTAYGCQPVSFQANDLRFHYRREGK